MPPVKTQESKQLQQERVALKVKLTDQLSQVWYDKTIAVLVSEPFRPRSVFNYARLCILKEALIENVESISYSSFHSNLPALAFDDKLNGECLQHVDKPYINFTVAYINQSDNLLSSQTSMQAVAGAVQSPALTYASQQQAEGKCKVKVSYLPHSKGVVETALKEQLGAKILKEKSDPSYTICILNDTIAPSVIQEMFLKDFSDPTITVEPVTPPVIPSALTSPKPERKIISTTEYYRPSEYYQNLLLNAGSQVTITLTDTKRDYLFVKGLADNIRLIIQSAGIKKVSDKGHVLNITLSHADLEELMQWFLRETGERSSEPLCCRVTLTVDRKSLVDVCPLYAACIEAGIALGGYLQLLVEVLGIIDPRLSFEEAKFFLAIINVRSLQWIPNTHSLSALLVDLKSIRQGIANIVDKYKGSKALETLDKLAKLDNLETLLTHSKLLTMQTQKLIVALVGGVDLNRSMQSVVAMLEIQEGQLSGVQLTFIKKLREILGDTSNITPTHFDQNRGHALTALLKDHWREIEHTENSYFPQRIDALAVRLSRCPQDSHDQLNQQILHCLSQEVLLKGCQELAKIINLCDDVSSSYLTILIPKLQHQETAIFRDRLDDLALDELIITDDGKYCLSVEELILSYETTATQGLAMLCNPHTNLPLSDSEIKQLQRQLQCDKHKTTKEKYQKTRDNNPILSRLPEKTFYALKLFVEQAVNPLAQRYHDENLATNILNNIQEAGEHFRRHVNSLQAPHRNALFNCMVVSGGYPMKFEQFYQQVFGSPETGTDGESCANEASKHTVIRLLHQYKPDISFRNKQAQRNLEQGKAHWIAAARSNGSATPHLLPAPTVSLENTKALLLWILNHINFQQASRAPRWFGGTIPEIIKKMHKALNKPDYMIGEQVCQCELLARDYGHKHEHLSLPKRSPLIRFCLSFETQGQLIALLKFARKKVVEGKKMDIAEFMKDFEDSLDPNPSHSLGFCVA